MGDQRSVDLFLVKILTALAIFLSLSGLTFAAELKNNLREAAMVTVTPDISKTVYATGVLGWVQRSKAKIDPGIRKDTTITVHAELSGRAKAAAHGRTDVPGWVRQSKPEIDPIRKQAELSKRKQVAVYGRTDVPGWVRRSRPETDPNMQEESLVSQTKKELIDHAKTYLGSPYKYGGNGLSGIDCSGFVKNVYDKFGIKLPRTARQQYMMGTSIDREKLSMGDLIFFRQGHSGDPSHVGIFLEDGKFIHSSARRNGGVRVDSLEDNLYRHGFVGGRKLVE